MALAATRSRDAGDAKNEHAVRRRREPERRKFAGSDQNITPKLVLRRTPGICTGAAVRVGGRGNDSRQFLSALRAKPAEAKKRCTFLRHSRLRVRARVRAVELESLERAANASATRATHNRVRWRAPSLPRRYPSPGDDDQRLSGPSCSSQRRSSVAAHVAWHRLTFLPGRLQPQLRSVRVVAFAV